jgi:DNA primase
MLISFRNILAPVHPELRFPHVRRFAKALAQEVERRVGDQDVATTIWRARDRRGIFVDYSQNARDRTIASAYSVRATPDARVSAPMVWDEVGDVEPAAFTLETMRGRVAEVGDLTATMPEKVVPLRPRMKRVGIDPDEGADEPQ